MNNSPTASPSLDHSITAFEADQDAASDAEVPIDRVFFLGAGFSRAFGFTTSADILSGALVFAETKLTHLPDVPNPWLQRNYRKVTRWLSFAFPEWRRASPNLLEIANRFFAGSSTSSYHDALGCHERDESWERDSYVCRPPESFRFYSEYMLSLEVFLCIYLFAGLTYAEALPNWATRFFAQLTPSDVIVTVNWDVLPEFALTQMKIPFSRYEWRGDCVKLVKLHGSIDLLGFPNDKMRAWAARHPESFEQLTEVLWRARTAEGLHPRSRPLPFGRQLFIWECYNKSAVLIMPPYYTLGYGYRLIQFNWRKAATAIARAKKVIILGYSFSSFDAPVLELLRSTCASGAQRVEVWNPDESVGERAASVFGPGRAVYFQRTADEVA